MVSPSKQKVTNIIWVGRRPVKFIADRSPHPDLSNEERDGAGAEDGRMEYSSSPERAPHPDLWSTLHSHVGEEGAHSEKVKRGGVRGRRSS